MKLRNSITALVTIGVLTGCVTKPNDELLAEAQEALRTGETAGSRAPAGLPSELRDELRRPASAIQEQRRYDEPRFSIQARGVDAADFFAQLTDDSPYSVVVHPQIEGSITVNLRNVTMQEALDVVQDIYGYDIRREASIYRIFPAGMRTETISLNYLALSRFGMSNTMISSGGVADQNNQNNRSSGGQFGNQAGGVGGFGGIGGAGGLGGLGDQGAMGRSGQTGSMISTTSETDFWDDLADALSGIVGSGDGRRVIVSPQAGLATVHAYPHEIRSARDFLSSAESSLQRQVVLEARIVEVSLSEGYQQGIDWSKVTSRVGGGVTEFTFGAQDLETSTLGGVVGMQFQSGSFSGMLEMLATQGQVQVLSNPRVTATNNQKAVIKIGEDEYFVTDVSTTTITGTATTTTPNVQLTPFFSGIALDVTPQIGDDGTITLHIRPSVTETTEQEKRIVLNRETLVLPLARSNIREADTIIRARDGEVVVIGGLMQTSYTDQVSQVPLLGNIPGIGELFKNRRQRETKKELVIMLRPTIVGVDTWDTELESSRELLRRWYESQ